MTIEKTLVQKNRIKLINPFYSIFEKKALVMGISELAAGYL